MRDIKFRAWDRNEKVMAEVTSIHFSKSRYTMVKYRIKKNGKSIDEWSHIDQKGWGNVSLMKYTGFKDKNGVEIYEGDIAIVKLTDAAGNSLASYHIIKNPFDYDLKEAMWIRDANEIEVLGNIFENEDLLEEQV